MDGFLDFIIGKYNYWAYVILMMLGLYAMIAKTNIVKKIIGMNIFQTSIILFYVSTAFKKGGTLPILQHGHGHDASAAAIRAADYINPLPHVLMLTAIVVSVATLGVALALALKVYAAYGTLEEDDLNEQIREQADTK
ncbi:MAG: NADH-quinone oxidoreductase subunit J [Deltaproteobacteria bacterium]|nr:MAG: NADH-quinone oxidoreductase subunit J [Deltaproteobacteria bacterium]